MTKRYSNYKDSCIEWIGEIPSHWEVSKTKYLTKNLDGQRVPLSSEQRGDREKIFPYWGSNGVIDFIDEFLFDGEFVLVGEDGSPFFDKLKDVSFYVNERVWVNNHIHILKPYLNKINPRFLTHSFNITDYKSYISGSTRDKLTQSDLNTIVHVLPPLPEQEQIIKYLDEKTTQLDSLISITEKKIELLKQKRTSLINEVVTKGLNPDVELKDSGVEWIGMIPKHWDSFSLKRVLKTLTDFESNGSFSSVKENVDVSDEGDVWYVRMTDLENNNLRDEKCKYCDLETYTFLSKTTLFGGELLITKRGEIGKVYIFPMNMGKSTLGPNSYLLRFDDRVLSNFLYWYYKSDYGQTTLKLLDNSTTIGSLYKDDIKGSPIVLPSLSEQNEIVEYIDTHTSEIDKLVSIEQRRIETLKEYRQSLISEVVTGKHKVTKD